VRSWPEIDQSSSTSSTESREERHLHIRVFANSKDRFLFLIGQASTGLARVPSRDRDVGRELLRAIKSSSFIHTVIPEEFPWAKGMSKGRLDVERRQQRYRGVNKSRMNEQTRRAPYSNVFEGEYPLTNRFSWPIPRARARDRNVYGRVSRGRLYTWRVNKG